jgi:hypothetical protein
MAPADGRRAGAGVLMWLLGLGREPGSEVKSKDPNAAKAPSNAICAANYQEDRLACAHARPVPHFVYRPSVFSTTRATCADSNQTAAGRALRRQSSAPTRTAILNI